MLECLNDFKPYLNWVEKLYFGRDQARQYLRKCPIDREVNRILCYGMGGSAAAGLICQEIQLVCSKKNNFVVVDPFKPVEVFSTDLAVFLSHSGNTWEIIKAFDSFPFPELSLVLAGGGQLLAKAIKSNFSCCLVKTQGTPRQDLYIFFGFLLELAFSLGIVCFDVIDQIFSSAEVLCYKDVQYDMFLSKFARFSSFHIFGISGDSQQIAVRAQNQFAENSKVRAPVTVLPEGFHNIFAAFEGGNCDPVLFFHTQFLDHSIKKRVDCSKKILAGQGVELYTAPVLGNTWINQYLSLVIWSDLASVHLAHARGKDPDSIVLIDALKSAF